MGGDRMIDKFDTPAPDGINNIGYFYENDALLNIHNEVIFSVLGRYNCFAGCKICYTEKHFKQALPDFVKTHIPKEINPDIEAQWFNIFDHFKHISNIDDLFWMKHEQPHLFDWYKKHSNKFQWGSMTDNNFIRTQPIFVNELDADTKIQEISFSDEWLERVNLKEVLYKLEELNKRNGINKLKFILTKPESMAVNSIIEWQKNTDIQYNCSHHNFKNSTIKLESDIPQARHIASYDNDVYPVCRESNYLMNTGFFLTLITSIDTVGEPYYQFENFDTEKHLSSMIKGKVELYKNWANMYEQGSIPDNGAGKNYFDYYRFVANNVTVNEDYTFIPIDMLNAKHRYYHKLIEAGWTITDYGLLKNSPKGVVPLVEVKNG